MVAAINVGEAVQFSKGGVKLRNLGQTSLQRNSLAPTIRTFKEEGFDVDLSAMRALAAPKGLPVAIRDRLVKALALALADPGFQVKASGVLFQPVRHMTPQEFTAFIRKSEPRFQKLWDEVPWSDK
jgi:tripartite-type tricarboxylate transporter receptor subunit TctC